jgi:hypothetical protein
MLRADYPPLKGAQQVADGMGRRYPVNMEFVKASNGYGFKHFRPLLDYGSLQSAKAGLLEKGDAAQQNKALRVNCARNQLQFLAFSLYLSKMLAGKARAEESAGEKEFSWVLGYLRGAVKGEAVPFEIFGLEKFATSYVKAAFSKHSLSDEELGRAILLMGNIMMGAMQIKWHFVYRLTETHKQAYHTMVHAALLVEKLADYTIRMHEDERKEKEIFM